jgi:DNA-directed RNA polymerase subunit RPC12/RpoP
MSKDLDFTCQKCGFGLHYFYYAYVVDDKGERVFCPPPDPNVTARKILGPGVTEEALKRRTGLNESFMCKICLMESVLDAKKDQLVCPACRSRDLVRTKDQVGKHCPKCKKGPIEENAARKAMPTV